MVGMIVIRLVVVARRLSGQRRRPGRLEADPLGRARSGTRDRLLQQQMLDAQNEYRRRRGAAELTEEDAERMAREDEAHIRERGRRADQDPG